ncbi:MAG: hypothetical protein GY820_39500 [Gammaproteobacteria bacterium]|nr:hypothetical protein [Gammaproteobacteria bacterium]
MSMGDEYNGYSNRPTWTVALWLDNDKGTQEAVREMAESVRAVSEATEFLTAHEVAVRDLESALKDYAEELCPSNAGASMESDLIGWVLAWVDWRELAENYLSELDS